MQPPVLYSYRRCPYAMRARMALQYAGISVEIREIDLKNKPQSMRNISPKATVPVLSLPDGRVIEQSLDIMVWALQQQDAENWLLAEDTDRANDQVDEAKLNSLQQDMHALISRSDSEFKSALDRYKYAERFPQLPPEDYRGMGVVFLLELENRLASSAYLCGDACCMADIAIFPFIRQFAAVDAPWFSETPYTKLKFWLHGFINSELFLSVMKKYPVWTDSDNLLSMHTG